MTGCKNGHKFSLSLCMYPFAKWLWSISHQEAEWVPLITESLLGVWHPLLDGTEANICSERLGKGFHREACSLLLLLKTSKCMHSSLGCPPEWWGAYFPVIPLPCHPANSHICEAIPDHPATSQSMMWTSDLTTDYRSMNKPQNYQPRCPRPENLRNKPK